MVTNIWLFLYIAIDVDKLYNLLVSVFSIVKMKC